MLSVREAAEFLSIKERTLTDWLTTKRYPIKHIKVGRLVRFREEDLLEFIESQVRTAAKLPA
ncbi:MAG: helix-turn-helix domain-containing protein [Puniceicoccales bacterium]|nr:helix-turn-helix domain-containing protein [Puniceicoccales bacterium]